MNASKAHFGILLACIIACSIIPCDAIASIKSIKFENGRYNDILIAIDPGEDKIDSSKCPIILQQLKVLLPLFSEKLYQATEGRASLGSVNILLPNLWTSGNCELAHKAIEQAEASHTYEHSHFKLTQNHPMTYENSLPWTKQYRPCGQPSDSIFIPLPFLEDTDLTDPVKGLILLHEWTKFRYGAFDEIAYDNSGTNVDGVFSPCYIHAKQALLTCCSNSPDLHAVAGDASACTLEFLQRVQNLREKLEQGSTSIMSSPYISAVTHFCNESTHNPWAPTKQNYYCDRKSVSEVVNSHADFNLSSTIRRQDPPRPPPPEIRIIQHQGSLNAAYAFVIEDSPDMRNQYKLQHVKQAIAQMLSILNYGTNVYVFIYSDGAIPTRPRRSGLENDNEKVQILTYIPDINSKIIRNSTTDQSGSRLLTPVIQEVANNLSTAQTYAWNVYLFSNGLDANHPVNDMLSAINIFKDTPSTMSIFTFENPVPPSSSDQWLQWYGIPNTKNVVALPSCVQNNPSRPCSFQTSSFILDHFVGSLNDQPYNPRFLKNPTKGPIAVTNQAGQHTTFSLPAFELSESNYFFLTIPENSIVEADYSKFVRLRPPIEQQEEPCIPTRLLEYNNVLHFKGAGCNLAGSGGEWTIEVLQQISSGVLPLLLHVWMEVKDSNKIMMTPSLGVINPTQGIISGIIPVFVALQTPEGYPVLDAQVSIHVWYPSLLSDNLPSTQINLRDDGAIGADQTSNDGVYSAYLDGLSTTSAGFHLIQVKITTSLTTKILKTIYPPKAIQMDNKMTGKCCGKFIRPLTAPLWPSEITFQSLHLGFKTAEIWAQPRWPPEEITSLKTADQNDSSITVEFTAVKGDNNGGNIAVSGYEACCVGSNGTEDTVPIPTESSCKPDTMDCGDLQGPGELQHCVLEKQKAVDVFVPSDERGMVDHLKCGIRAININSEIGPVSTLATFDADVTVILRQGVGGGGTQQSCEEFSLSDKCLPLWIFWVMIGCLGLLLLILVVVGCCWWCSCRKNNKKKPVVVKPVARENVLAVHYTPPPQEPPSTSTSNNAPPLRDHRNEEDPKVVKELFVNHAYIQDGDGEIKIIADNGQILRKPKMENDHGQYPPRNQVRSPVSPVPILSNSQPTTPNDHNMQVFKPVPMPKPNRPLRQQQLDKKGDRRRPEIIHPNPMLMSDTSYNHPPPPTATRGPPPQQQFESSPPAADPALVYATISRRFKPPNGQQPPVRQITFDPHYQVPHSNNSVPAAVVQPQAFQRQSQTRNPPLPRSPPEMPNYPTTTMSESESSTSDYEAGHQGQRQRRIPPRFTKPPPYPAGSQLVHNNNNNDPRQRFGARGGGVGAPPMTNPPPPVPPPRYDRSASMKNQNNGPAVQHFSSKQDMLSTDDDDSDEWDDGDGNYGFDNTTGVSYA